MIWLMDILKICLEEQLLINYYMINHLNITKNMTNMMDMNVDLLQWFIIFLIKSLQVVPLHLQINLLIKDEIITNQQLVEKLQKLKLGKQKVYSYFKGNICGADLADIKVINKYK